MLVRSPYGRAGWVGAVFGRLVAERGHQVVVQSVRGTRDSQGELSPFDEADDGVATVRWLTAQPWCDGRVVTLGPSYLGITQWALAPDAGPALRAMGTMVTASQFRDQTYPGGTFSLDNGLSWAAMMSRRAAPGRLAEIVRHRCGCGLRDRAALRRGHVAVGAPIDFFQDWLREHAPDSAYWAKRSYAERVAEVARHGVAVSMTSGWQDIFLPWQLDDHAALRAAGARPLLRDRAVGPHLARRDGGRAARRAGPVRPHASTPSPGPRKSSRSTSSCPVAEASDAWPDWPPEPTSPNAPSTSGPTTA